MERFIKTMAESLDRRAFFRRLGKMGMGAAAVLLASRSSAQSVPCPPGSDRQCKGKNIWDFCGGGRRDKDKSRLCLPYGTNGACICIAP